MSDRVDGLLDSKSSIYIVLWGISADKRSLTLEGSVRRRMSWDGMPREGDMRLK